MALGTETGGERIGKNRSYKCRRCGEKFELFLRDPLPKDKRICIKCRENVRVMVEVPKESIAGILLSSDPSGMSIVQLAFKVRRALEQKLGWSAEVESDLDASLGPRGTPGRYRGLLDATLMWVEKRLEELNEQSD